MNEIGKKATALGGMDILLTTTEGAVCGARFRIVTEALFNAASLGYKGESLSFDSFMLDAVVRAVYPASYRKTLETLRAKAKREHENVEPEEDEF
jgi:hypothetical protein